MEIVEKLKNCKSYIEAAKILLGVNYTNGRIQKQLIDYC